MDRCEAGVAGAHAGVPVVFEVIEERRDQSGVQFGDVKLAWWGCGLVGGEGQE
ncbi:hypothetical protein JOF56_006255 [Kibdelosporangium banguiense]|uniref:Uncharacterized protein n=1 Tax=Kibdelosporangium banguiense TaxID=1365924 RepID=A0ABS4TN84_9PSEU|nr:hypothetical protein [Kibdelosporangium banguiense]MBP2325870.1 hypothetical protein [Kibdelosporangium banguiense]